MMPCLMLFINKKGNGLFVMRKDKKKMTLRKSKVFLAALAVLLSLATVFMTITPAANLRAVKAEETMTEPSVEEIVTIIDPDTEEPDAEPPLTDPALSPNDGEEPITPPEEGPLSGPEEGSDGEKQPPEKEEEIGENEEEKPSRPPMMLGSMLGAPLKYTVAFDANGGTDAPEPLTHEAGAAVVLPNTIPVRDGYRFLGWGETTTADLSSLSEPGGNINPAIDTERNFTLYANWELITYGIKYDANGGANAPDAQKDVPDATISITASEPTRDGYEFLGWNTDNTATTADSAYAPGASYVVPADHDITLYAVWQEDTSCTLTYVANGGNGAPAPQKFEALESIPLSNTIPTREGYHFIGWAFDSDAYKADYRYVKINDKSYGFEVTSVEGQDKDVTLYAVWEEQYVLTFDANGGTGAPEPKKCWHDDDVYFDINEIPTRDGYTFKGWSAGNKYTSTPMYEYFCTLDEEGKVTDSYFNRAFITMPNIDYTLYAVWEAPVRLVFDANGGTGGPSAARGVPGDIATISNRAPKQNAYEFLGWSLDPNATETDILYKAGDEFELLEECSTLYAVWTPKEDTFTLTYDANGGTGAPPEQAFFAGDDVYYNTDIHPTRDGRLFVGWSASPTATEPVEEQDCWTYIDPDTDKCEHFPESFIGPDGDITLYAMWDTPHTLTFDANGGTGAPEPRQFWSGEEIFLNEKYPTREGYAFAGWEYEKDGWWHVYSINYNNYKDVYEITMPFYGENSDVTLCAVWEEGFELAFDPNGGTGGPENVRLLNSQKYYNIPTDNIPVRPGYQFIGWDEDPDAEYPSIEYRFNHRYNWDDDEAVGDEYSGRSPYFYGSYDYRGNDITLYAIWQPCHVLTYDANGGDPSSVPPQQPYLWGEHVALNPEHIPTREGYKFLGWSLTPVPDTNNDFASEENEEYNLYNFYRYFVYDYILQSWEAWEDYPDLYEKSPFEGIWGYSDGSPLYLISRPWFWGPGKETTDSFSAPEYRYYDIPGMVSYFDGPDYDVTLYAVWEPADEEKPYTLTFDGNGGDTNIPAPIMFSENEGVTLPFGNFPTREGYEFEGWSWTPTTFGPYSSEEEVPDSDERIPRYSLVGGEGGLIWNVPTVEPPNSDCTLYACWEKLCTLTFDANGGDPSSVPPPITDWPLGKDISLGIVPEIPSREGYKFIGWSESPDSTDPEYKLNNGHYGYQYDENYVPMYDDKTLYAVWEPCGFILTYDANGGMGAPSPVGFSEGDELCIVDVLPTRDGYKFFGWDWDKNFDPDSGLPEFYCDIQKHFYYWDTVKFNPPAHDCTLYAVWVPTHTLTYDANGGTGAPESIVFVTGDELDIEPEYSKDFPIRKGYEFLGWSFDADGITPEFAATDDYGVSPDYMIGPDEDVTLYALWDGPSTLSYNANGGSDAPEPYTGMPEEVTTISEYEPQRDGYVFKGWSKDRDALEPDDKYAGGEEFVMPYHDTVLYAVWEGVEYKLIYDANGGTNAPATQVGDCGDILKISKNVPTREGYEFKGWSENDKATTADTKYNGGKNFLVPEHDTTIYAVWTPAPYKLIYDANGGKDAPDTQTGTTGSTLTVSSDEPTREGYTFKGWNESRTATTPDTNYDGGSTYTVPPHDTTVYAVWERNEYSLIYDENGGKEGTAPDTQTDYFEETITVSSGKPTREGYTFKGWNESKTATAPDTNYNGGSKYTVPAHDTTIYAIWTPNPYKLIYHENGGKDGTAPDTQTDYCDNTIKVSNGKPTRDGYTFLGWNENKNAAEPDSKYDGGSNFTVPSHDTDIYAVWTPNPYKLIYDENGGKEGTAPDIQTGDCGSTLTVSSGKPTRDGYTFIGWNEDKNAVEPDSAYNGGSSYVVPAHDNTVYAVWDANEYNLIYDANGGKNAPATQTGDYGSKLIVSSSKPTRDGYTFMGWNEDKDATAADSAYAGGSEYVVPAHDTTVYAVWKANPYKLIYDENGGKEGTAPDTQTGELDEKITISTDEPTRDGYTFKGWNESKTAIAPDPAYNGGNEYTVPAHDTTVYAVWEINPYNLIYDANGGTNAPATQTGNYGTNLVVSSGKPVREGYTFKGWSENDKATDADTAYAPGANYVVPAHDTTVYAIWDANKYNLIYDVNGGDTDTTPDTQSGEFGSAIIVDYEDPSRDGYTFLGWNEDSNATTPDNKYADGSDYVVPAHDTTVYAVWKADEYKLSYDVNGGNEGTQPEDQTGKCGENIKIDSDTPTKNGYVFDGWSEDKDATSGDDKYAPGSNFTIPPHDTTLYAIWKLTPYSLIYDANGGINEPETQTDEHGKTIKVSSGVPERKGYKFLGWNSNPAATEPDPAFAGGSDYVIPEIDKTVYAVWEIIPYKITYVYNDGEPVPTNPTTYTVEDILDIEPTAKDGYIFTGWVDEDGNKVEKLDGSEYARDITLTAEYKHISFFPSGGGSTGPKTGDEIVLWPYAVAFLTSAILLVVLIALKKKKVKNRIEE